MYRDFSEKSKSELLGLVSQVENEKISNFTDWIGDRWYDFEGWIGKLNIKNCLNNVNAYHKKVIDKNNATKAQIEKIFTCVAVVDSIYRIRLCDARTLLEKWQNYISQMQMIICPSNGKFNVEYMDNTLGNSLSGINKAKLDDEKIKTEQEKIKDAFKAESAILKSLSKIPKDKKDSNDVGLIASAMSYIAGLYSFYTAEYDSVDECATGCLKLVKTSASAWGGVYKYLEKTLTPYQASKFGKKYQTKVGVVSLVGDVCGFTSEAIETFDILMNEDAETHEKVSQVLKNMGAGTDIAQSIVELKYGQKVLTKTVTAKYQWDKAAGSAAKLDNASAVCSVINILIDTGSEMANRYGKVTEDGTFDMRDIGEVGIASSIRGLTSVVNEATCGLSDALGLSDKAEDISDGIMEWAETDAVDYVVKHEFSTNYIKNSQYLKEIADNQENSTFVRVGASAIAGLGMIGAMTVDGISDGVCWIGDKISSGWNAFRSYI